jgi:hypothetical protein
MGYIAQVPDNIRAPLKTSLTGREKTPSLGYGVKIPVIAKNSREGMGSP